MTKYTAITTTEVDVPEPGTPDRDSFAAAYASVLEDDEILIIIGYSEHDWNVAFAGMLLDTNMHNVLRGFGIDPSQFIISYKEEIA